MKNKNVINRLCVFLGIAFIVSAALLMFSWQKNMRSAQQAAEACVQVIRASIPQPHGAVPEERRNNTMAVLSVNGTDFVGLLEMPRYGSVLPVAADWKRPDEYPCRFSGSVYDGSLQVGLTSQKGQYDFYREICVGDSLFFTDMEGNRYAYTITDLRYEKHADQATLQRKDAAFTLFVKNIHALEYLIIFCDIAD